MDSTIHNADRTNKIKLGLENTEDSEIIKKKLIIRSYGAVNTDINK